MVAAVSMVDSMGILPYQGSTSYFDYAYNYNIPEAAAPSASGER